MPDSTFKWFSLKWEKLEDIETTFAGVVSLRAGDTEEKREEAQDIVETKIRDVLEDNRLYSDVWVYISLMVDGLGKFMEFRI